MTWCVWIKTDGVWRRLVKVSNRHEALLAARILRAAGLSSTSTLVGSMADNFFARMP